MKDDNKRKPSFLVWVQDSPEHLLCASPYAKLFMCSDSKSTEELHKLGTSMTLTVQTRPWRQAGGLAWARELQSWDSDTGQFDVLILYPVSYWPSILQSLEGTEGSLHLGTEAATRPLIQGTIWRKSVLITVSWHICPPPRPDAWSPLLPGGFPSLFGTHCWCERCRDQAWQVRKLRRPNKNSIVGSKHVPGPKGW